MVTLSKVASDGTNAIFDILITSIMGQSCSIAGLTFRLLVYRLLFTVY